MEIVHEKYRERYRLLGLRIAYYRKRKGYTQEQFAELIGKSWSFISQVEANNGATLKGISLDTLFSMSDALGFPPSKNLEEELIHTKFPAGNSNRPLTLAANSVKVYG